jgi:hypothetical protein
MGFHELSFWSGLRCGSTEFGISVSGWQKLEEFTDPVDRTFSIIGAL